MRKKRAFTPLHPERPGLLRRGVTGFTLIELAAVAGIFFMIFVMLAPFVQMVKARAGRIACSQNLMKISIGLHRYATDHGGAFPSELGALYPDYVKDPKAFNCPASKAAGTPEAPDYSYTAGLKKTSPQKYIIASDLDGNHGKHGRNILRVNGDVERVR